MSTDPNPMRFRCRATALNRRVSHLLEDPQLPLADTFHLDGAQVVPSALDGQVGDGADSARAVLAHEAIARAVGRVDELAEEADPRPLNIWTADAEDELHLTRASSEAEIVQVVRVDARLKGHLPPAWRRRGVRRRAGRGGRTVRGCRMDLAGLA